MEFGPLWQFSLIAQHFGRVSFWELTIYKITIPKASAECKTAARTRVPTVQSLNIGLGARTKTMAGLRSKFVFRFAELNLRLSRP